MRFRFRRSFKVRIVRLLFRNRRKLGKNRKTTQGFNRTQNKTPMRKSDGDVAVVDAVYEEIFPRHDEM